MQARLSTVHINNGNVFLGLRLLQDFDAKLLPKLIVQVRGNNGVEEHGIRPSSLLVDSLDTPTMLVVATSYPPSAITITVRTMPEQAQGSCTVVFEEELSPKQLEWKNRYGSRLQKQQWHAIADINSLELLGWPYFRVVECWRDDNLWRFISTFPANSRRAQNDKLLRAFNFEGTEDFTVYCPNSVGNARDLPEYIHWSLETTNDKFLLATLLSDDANDETTLFFFPELLQALCAKHYANAYESDINAYEQWLNNHYPTEDELARQRSDTEASSVLFSIIVPLFHTPLDFFHKMLDSVIAQTYANWELVLVNASPSDTELCEHVRRAAEDEPRITVLELEGNLGITLNTAAGIEASHGDYVCFLDHDDFLEAHTLYEYARTIQNEASDVLYCDEDMFEHGRYCKPLIKPGFNIDLLRSKNYIIHFLCIRRSILNTMPKLGTEIDGAQDYHATLWAAEHARVISHIPSVLYHWRSHEASIATNADAKPYAEDAGLIALQLHLDRTCPGATAHHTDIANIYCVDYPGTAPLIALCGDSTVSELLNQQGVSTQVLSSFGTASLNKAVQDSSAEIIAFFPPGCRPIDETNLSSLATICLRNDVGALGGVVLNPNRRVLCAGYALPDANPLPLHQGLYYDDEGGYLFFPHCTQNIAALPLAGLVISRRAFLDAGGFDEHLEDNEASINLCQKLSDRGLLCVLDGRYHIGAQALEPASSECMPKTIVNKDNLYFSPNLDPTMPQLRLQGLDSYLGGQHKD